MICRAAAGEPVEDLLPPDVSARARVHEYGGGDYTVGGAGVFFVSSEGGIWRAPEDGSPAPVAGTAADAAYADLAVSPGGRWLVAVEERTTDGETKNRLMAFPLAGGTPVAFASRHDFVSSPCFSPDGSRLAYLCWDHPDMPWDATELRELPFGPEGPAGPARRVAGGGEESIFQPGYSPAGRLTFVSDRDGFWNLHQEREGAVRNLCPRESEFGVPQWVFGMTTWAFLGEDAIVCAVRDDGKASVAHLDLVSGALRDLGLPLCEVTSVSADGGRVALIGSAPEVAENVLELRLSDGLLTPVRSASELPFPTEGVSRGEAAWFETAGGERAHAFFYAPCNEAVEGPAGEAPPALVRIHGGPTGAASAGLDLGIQYWTQRGFAVVDVNHRGSTGFGRAYRNRLRGEWGVVDVEDCLAAARALAGRGGADPARLVIRGGSAGGFTVLSALAFHEGFAAGCSRYGVADLAALAADTHKFESRYLDRLVAPWPEGRDVYRRRSPLFHLEGLSAPVIFFQGTEDRVVPPSQTERMVEALAERGTPHAYVSFEGEGHGFRRAETVVTCLEAEHWFYGEVLGFDAGPAPEGVRLR